MFKVSVSENGAEPTIYTFDKSEITLGRVKGNDVVLPKTTVSKRHARVVLKEGKMYFIDLKSMNGTFINGSKITTATLITDSDRVTIGDFFLYFSEEGADNLSAEGTDNDSTRFGSKRDPGVRLPTQSESKVVLPGVGVVPGVGMAPAGGPPPIGTGMPLGPGGGASSVGLPQPGSSPQEPAANASYPHPSSIPSVSGSMLEEKKVASSSISEIKPGVNMRSSHSGRLSARTGIHELGIEEIHPATWPETYSLEHENDAKFASSLSAARRVMGTYLSRHEVQHILEIPYPASAEDRTAVTHEICQILAEISDAVGDADKEDVVRICVDELLGFGVLERILDAEGLLRATVTTPQNILVEYASKRVLSALQFTGPDTHYITVSRLLATLGLNLQTAPAFADIRMGDGTIVTVAQTPTSPSALISVNRSTPTFRTLSEMTQSRVMTKEIQTFLEMIVKARRNVLVVGLSGVAKRELIRALASLSGGGERIAVFENMAMLNLTHPGAMNFEAQNPMFYPTAEMSQLISQCSKLSPERIVIDTLQSAQDLIAYIGACCAGAQGNFVTFGAPRAIDAVSRLNELLTTDKLLSGDLIPAYFDFVISVKSYNDGSGFKITEIAQTTVGTHLTQIFKYEEEGMGKGGSGKGSFIACGVVPKFCKELETGGAHVDTAIFGA